MRDSAICDQHTKVFAVEEEASAKTFFSEITNSVSDIKVDRYIYYINNPIITYNDSIFSRIFIYQLC